MQVTNRSEAPQGVHTLGGVAYIMPGETKNLDLNEELAKLANQLDFLTVEGQPSKEELKRAELPSIDVPNNEVDQLRQQLESSTADVTRLNGSLDDAIKEISRQKGLVSDRDTEIAGLKGTVTDLQDQIVKLNETVAAAGQQQSTEQNQQAAAPVGPFEVRDTNPGWFGIFGADGNQVGKSIRASDADAFKAMTPDEQLAYLSAPSTPSV